MTGSVTLAMRLKHLLQKPLVSGLAHSLKRRKKVAKVLLLSPYEKPKLVKLTGRWAVIDTDLVIEVTYGFFSKEFVSYTRVHELFGN